MVEEADLDFTRFRCCGDEDLYPFGCPGCARLMVFCYECDTLHDDLVHLGRHSTPANHSDPTQPAFDCPGCGRPLEYYLVRDGLYKVPLAQWVGSGFGHLLAMGVAGAVDDGACTG